MCTFQGLRYHLLPHLILQLQVQILYPFALKIVIEFSSSIENVGNLVALEELLTTHAAVLVPQKESIHDLCDVEGHMSLHFLVFDPMSAFEALGTNLQVSELDSPNYMSCCLPDYV